MKIAKLRDPLFSVDIQISFGSLDEITAYLRKGEKIENLNIHPKMRAFSCELPSGKYHIHFDYYGFTAIVHETNHITLDILNDRGIEVSQATKEIFAYYQDWLAGKCRDYLELWSKSSSKKGKNAK